MCCANLINIYDVAVVKNCPIQVLDNENDVLKKVTNKWKYIVCYYYTCSGKTCFLHTKLMQLNYLLERIWKALSLTQQHNYYGILLWHLQMVVTSSIWQLTRFSKNVMCRSSCAYWVASVTEQVLFAGAIYIGIALLVAGWNELLIAAFSHRSIASEDGILLATGLHVRRDAAHEAGVGTIFDRVLVELVARMREMKMDKSELGCLRAIILFNPGQRWL